jgi:hypothetical protein
LKANAKYGAGEQEPALVDGTGIVAAVGAGESCTLAARRDGTVWLSISWRSSGSVDVPPGR